MAGSNLSRLAYLFVIILSVRCEVEWYYPAVEGDEQWPESHCRGSRQSPVDIQDNETRKFDANEIKLNNYDREAQVIGENNGYNVMFRFLEKDTYITGGNLIGKYELMQIHFHWKAEHTIDGQRFPLEAHFVHSMVNHRSRRAAKNIDANTRFHVLGVLFYITEMNNTDLADFIDVFDCVSLVGESKAAKIKPRNLLPENLETFYSYEGSLTTPNCNEIVHWTVFPTKVGISEKQYEVIKRTATLNGTYSRNYRGVQPLNGRIIKRLTVIDTEGLQQKYLYAIVVILILVVLLVSTLCVKLYVEHDVK